MRDVAQFGSALDWGSENDPNALETDGYGPGVTLGDMMRQWAIDRELDCAPSTAHWYADVVRLYLQPLIGGYLPRELTGKALNDMTRELLGRGLSVGTVRGAHRTLSAFLRDAGIDLPKGTRRPRRCHTTGRKGVWTAEQAAKFLDTALNDRWAVAWGLIMFCGMRRAEVIGLRWIDVDLSDGVLHLREGVKGGRERSVPIGPLMIGLLEAAERRDDRVVPLSGPYLTHRWAALCERAGVPRIPPHDGRHTNATIAAVSGIDIRTMQDRLGHADAQTLIRTYLHVVTEAGRAAALAIERAMRPKELPPAA